MSTNNGTKSEVLFTEAPASWNTKYLSPDGFVCQLTLRADAGCKVLEKAKVALVHLMENDCTPYYYGNGPRQQVEAKSNENSKQANGNQPVDNPAWCRVHQCEMQRWEKEGRVWYSHKVDGQWCTGKAKSK